MSGQFDLEALAVRAALADQVTAYAMALDARDWTGFRALFEDEVEIDYSSLGSIKAVMPAQAWVDRCKVLGGFDATQHKVGNFVFEFAGDSAQVTAYVEAAHFIQSEGSALQGFVQGTYRHQLRRGPDGWRIRGCALSVAGYPGGQAGFDRAFDAARAAFALSQEAPS